MPDPSTTSRSRRARAAELDRGLALDLEQATRVAGPPPCAGHDRCGACELISVEYAAQIAAKSRALRLALAPLGCAAELVEDVTPLTHPLGSRTKLLMPAGGAAGALRFGFYRRGTLELVPAEECPLQHPGTLDGLARVRSILDATRVAPSTPERGGPGWLHAVALRADPASGSLELALAGRSTTIPGGPALVDELAATPGVRAVHLAPRPARSSYPLEPPLTHLAGAARTPFTLGGQVFRLSAATFFQTSAEGAELLWRAIEALLPAEIEELADLYAGAGLWALLSRDRWRRAVSVESNPSAVGDLEAFLEEHPLALDVLAGRVETRIPEVLDRRPSVVLLDPPRRGCHEAVIRALVERPVPVLLYVACGLTAFLRDARLLVEGGYRLARVAAVDLFPHTPHLEVVARLEPAP